MNTKREMFLQSAEAIKSLGFEVYLSADAHYNYGYAVKGNGFGYFQADEWAGTVRFSTCHKPCREWGTGFACQDPRNGLAAPTAADVLASFETPGYWGGKPVNVKRYASFEEFLAARSNSLKLVRL